MKSTRLLTKLAATAAIIIVGGAFALPTAAFAAAPMEVYAQLPRTSQVRVSPNGEKLAMLSPYKDYVAVFIYDLKDPSAKAKVLPAPEGALVKGVFWGSDDHILMQAQFRRKGGRGKMRKFGSQFSRVVSTNVNTGKSVIMLNEKVYDDSRSTSRVASGQGVSSQQGGSFVSRLNNDPNNVLMAWGEYTGKPFLRHFSVNLDTGEETLVRSLPISTNGVVMSVDGSSVLARSEYSSRSGLLEVFMGDSSSAKPIYTKTFDTDGNPYISLVGVLPDSGKVLMFEGEKEQLTLFTVDPSTGAQAPYRINASVPSGYDYFPMTDPYTDELVGVSYTDDYGREVYSAEPYKSWYSKAQAAFPGKLVYIQSRTRNNSAVTIRVADKGGPSSYYLYEPAKGSMSPLGGAYPELAPSDIGMTKRVDYVASDGLKIPAYLTLPPGKQASANMSLVVLPHGGPVGPRDSADFDFWTQAIANMGYAVFRPQFRGSGGFGYAHVEAGYGEFGGKMVSDTVEGVEMLIEKGMVNPDKICVTGASYGGYQAFQLPVVAPDMFKCSIGVNGVADIPAILKYEVARGGRNGGAIKFWNRVIGDYYEDRDIMKAQSPALSADLIKAEMIVVHGEDDMTVPFEQSEIMQKALKNQGQKQKILVLENDDHNLSLAESRRELLKASEELFAKHLK